jgi:hypothetical protein
MARATLRKSFAHFGVAPANPRWSWSARNLTSAIVVLVLWQDRFRVVNGRLVYVFDPSDSNPEAAGSSERLYNLQWAIDHCGGVVRIVVAIAKDVDAKPRAIADCFPQRTLVMRIVYFDPQTGKFRLEAV